MLNYTKTLFKYIFRYPVSALVFYILLIIFAIIENIGPYFYKLFVDTAQNGDTNQLMNVLLLYILVRFSEMIFEALARIQWDRTVFRAARDTRIDVVSQVHDLDFAYHLSKSTGSLISAVKRGDGAFYNFADVINFELARIIIGFIVMVSFLFSLRIEIALVMIATFVINAVAAYFLIKNNIKNRNRYNEKEDEISGIITDNLINFETVKLFAKEKWERNKLKESFKSWLTALWAYANSFRLIEIVAGTIGNIGIIAVLFISLNLLMANQITTGEFVLILGFVVSFYPRLFQVIFKLRDLAKSSADLEKYFSILDQEVKVKDPKKPSPITSVKGDLSFNNIQFTYPEGKDPVFDSFNLDIKQGQSVALVGRSGQGKSTLVKLLMRFYDVQKGDISVDGINIKKFSKSNLRSFIGVVPQEPILFNNTIAYNIGYGSDNPTDEEIRAAAKMAFLDEFIESLPQKYATNVGERGIKLSGGQKQRLAIARMILANPDIIIFDEATSHLDSESEKAIQTAFWKAVKGKTALVVAHRLSTIVNADVIVVIQDGKIIEKGSHRVLLQNKNGVYAHFWNLQTDIE